MLSLLQWDSQPCSVLGDVLGSLGVCEEQPQAVTGRELRL